MGSKRRRLLNQPPFQCGIFDGLETAPRATVVDDFCLEQAVDRLGPAWLSPTLPTEGWARFGKALGVADRQVLGEHCDEPARPLAGRHSWTACSMASRTKPCMGRCAEPPTRHPPSIGIDNEGDIAKPRHVAT
jgi:hypothetical protein